MVRFLWLGVTCWRLLLLRLSILLRRARIVPGSWIGRRWCSVVMAGSGVRLCGLQIISEGFAKGSPTNVDNIYMNATEIIAEAEALMCEAADLHRPDLIRKAENLRNRGLRLQAQEAQAQA